MSKPIGGWGSARGHLTDDLPASPPGRARAAGILPKVTLMLLVRHAATDVTGKRLTGQLPGFHLSEEGHLQADRAAERLGVLPVAAVYSSPLERCRETAGPLARAKGLPVTTVPELLDVGYGRWSGRPLAGLYRTKLWRQLVHAPSAVRFPDGETLGEVQRRAVSALDTIAERRGRARGARSDSVPVSFSRTILGTRSPSATALTEAGLTTRRWNRSMCTPA